ncbi:MAG TPA: type II secretion system F family protein [Methylococcus sp.]|nr:type II secretion system F family protein [Methylococcus sp.]
MDAGLFSFVLLVFLVVFVVLQFIIVPAFGPEGIERRRLHDRLVQIAQASGQSTTSLVRQEDLRRLSPVEQWLNRLPGMSWLEDRIERAGWEMPPYALALLSLGLGLLGALAAPFWFHKWWVAPAAAAVGVSLPFAKLRLDRSKRLDRFEEQLPDAMELMARSLKVGHPFNVAMAHIAKEMPDPIAREFRITLEEIHFGRELGQALNTLLLRVPSVSLMAMVTAILIQRDTGGNLSEILLKISKVLRERFKFERHVRTITAEGRTGGLVLSLMPFLVFGGLYWMNPDYYGAMLRNPIGVYALEAAGGLVTVGIVWIRYLVKIEV